MTPLRRFAYSIIVPIGEGIVRLLWKLVRQPRVEGLEHLEAALVRAPSLIPICWHQHILYCAKVLLEQRPRLQVGFLVSPSVDGEIGAMLCARVGARAIRGSATHTGARTLRDFYEALVKDSVSPLLTPDGPRGPRFVFKPGAILLAQMSGRPIVPMAYHASRAILFHWDRFVIPLPFARVTIVIGKPEYVPRTLSPEVLVALQTSMTADLKALFQQARELNMSHR
jgi:hypothetical protein